MGPLNEWKKRAAAELEGEAKPAQDTVRRQLLAASGADYFKQRDPVYHVAESFRQSFDLMGSARAGQEKGDRGAQNLLTAFMSGMEGIDGKEQEDGEKSASGAETVHGTDGVDDEARVEARADMSGAVEPTGGSQRMFLSRFSELAFNRGTMAGAVLRGTGKMMLVSCLKRTAGQSQPTNLRQRKLFEGASQRRAVAGSAPDTVLFNRGEVDGAVGLVVDTLRDARRSVDSLAKLADGGNVLSANSGTDTLKKMYPFLSDARERELLDAYRARLAKIEESGADAGDGAALRHAVDKTEAIIAKKAQMKVNFINALRKVSNRAQDALELFSQPGFTDELMDELTAGRLASPPPQEKPGAEESVKGHSDPEKKTDPEK